MAARPTTVDRIRYLDRSQLVPEQEVFGNYYREIISQFGIDTEYYRHDDRAFAPVSSDVYDYTYGDDTTRSYFFTAPLVIYMEANSDSVNLNRFGIETDGDMVCYIVRDDFTECFRDKLGAPRFDTISAFVSGNIVKHVGPVSGEVSNSEISGYTSIDVSFTNFPCSGGLVSTTVSGDWTRFPVKFNRFVAESEAYTERTVNGTLTGSVNGFLNGLGNGLVSGVVSGDLQYFVEPEQRYGENWGIAPQVGDFFRIDFDELNHEEYEITRVHDKNLESDGLNPLLSRYIWRMDCVRRDPSYEDVVGDEIGNPTEEEFTNDRQFLNDAATIVSDEIFDYDNEIVDEAGADDSTSLDDIYGGY